MLARAYQTVKAKIDLRAALWIVIALALLVRVGLAVALGDSAEPVSGAFDQVSYDALAQRVAEGKGFTFPIPWYPFTRAGEPTAHWSFLYTLYLACIYLLVGHHPLVARVIQALLSGVSLWLTYRIGSRLFGEWVGLAAAALSGAYAYLIFFNAALMTQTFYILCLLLAVDISITISQRPGFAARDWVMLGIALGSGTLMRQTMLLFVPILFAFIAWRWRAIQTGTSRTNLAGMLIAAAIVAGFVLPWTVRNYRVYNDFLLLNSNSGFWFFSSNHPNQGTHFDGNYVAPIPPELLGQGEPAIDRALLREGLGFIAANPVRFLLLSLDRIKYYFWFVPSEQSSLISNLSRLFSFTLYLPFMVYGLFLSRRQWRACLPLYLYVALDAGLCLTTWAAPRYRLPSDALMMVFAGLSVVDLAARFRHAAFESPRWAGDAGSG